MAFDDVTALRGLSIRNAQRYLLAENYYRAQFLKLEVTRESRFTSGIKKCCSNLNSWVILELTCPKLPRYLSEQTPDLL